MRVLSAKSRLDLKFEALFILSARVCVKMFPCVDETAFDLLRGFPIQSQIALAKEHNTLLTDDLTVKMFLSIIVFVQLFAPIKSVCSGSEENIIYQITQNHCIPHGLFSELVIRHSKTYTSEIIDNSLVINTEQYKIILDFILTPVYCAKTKICAEKTNKTMTVNL